MVHKIKQRLIMENVLDFDLVKGASVGGGDVVPAAGVALTDENLRMVRHTRLTLTGVVLAITAALDYGSVKICDLPDSNMVILGAELNLTSVVKDGTGIVDAAAVNVAVGTAAASAVTLAGTMIDVLPIKALAAVSPTTHVSHRNDGSPAIAWPLDAPTSALYLNAEETLTGDGDLTVTGTFDLFYLDTGNVAS